MNPIKAISGLAAGVLAALLVAAILWPVMAQIDPLASRSRALTLTTPQFGSPSRLHIPAAAFVQDGINPDSYQFVFNLGGPPFSGGGGYLRGNALAYGCLQAPAYLPDEVFIASLSAYVYDNDNARDLVIHLRRVHNTTGVAETIASLATPPGAASGIQLVSTSSVTQRVVEHPEYSYYVFTCLPSQDLALFAVNINYDNVDLKVSAATIPGILIPDTTAFAYKITVQNLGVEPALNVTLENALPAATTYVSAAPSAGSCSHVANTVNCSLGTLAGGGFATVIINVSLPPGFEGLLTNQSNVATTSDEFRLDNNNFTYHKLVTDHHTFFPAIFKNAP
jgi:uncharacterized repeat protein (TIGR01451 family)